MIFLLKPEQDDVYICIDVDVIFDDVTMEGTLRWAYFFFNIFAGEVCDCS